MRKLKLQLKVKNYLLTVLVVFILLPSLSSAAEISLDSKTKEIGVGSQFEVGFFLNTEGEDINAVEGKIIFPKTLLELKEIKDGNSIINFWI